MDRPAHHTGGPQSGHDQDPRHRTASNNPTSWSSGALSRLSERSFHRRFRQATGQSPIAYVQALRIEEAKHLLETTTASVDDIGAQVGYIEPASFRRLFRRAVGVSPSVYRRRFQPLFRLDESA